MTTAEPRPGCWPTLEQQWLLRAALEQSTEGLAAWEAWRQTAHLDQPLYGTQHLLPLLYRNLTDQGVKDPEMGILKGHYRLAWYRNQVLFGKMAELLQTLAEAGIPTMALKGAPLALQYYRDLGLRPMADFDLLVPPGQGPAMVALLQAQDWQPKGEPASLTPAAMSVSNGASFRSADGYEIDVHWYVLPECCYAGADDAFWRYSGSLEVGGAPTLAPHPTELLLHVCQHGYKWNPVPPFRWVADATILLRSAAIDWRRFLESAQSRRLVLPLRNTLHYLNEFLDLPIPGEVLEALDAQPVSGRERREYQALIQPLTMPHYLAMHWARHSRATGAAGRTSRILSFPGYLQRGLGLDHIWQVPVVALTEGVRRVRSKRGQGAAVAPAPPANGANSPAT